MWSFLSEFRWIFSGIGASLIILVLSVFVQKAANDRKQVVNQTISQASQGQQIVTMGDNSPVTASLIVKGPKDEFEETKLSPNAYRSIVDRLKQTGAFQTYSIRNEQDFDQPIQFLDQFVEKKGRVNLTPVLVTLKVEEGRTGREAYLDKVSAVDAIEYLRSYMITKRFPIKVAIYPAAVMKLTGKGMSFKLGKPGE